MSARVSVVIPTFNRSGDIGHLLNDISNQTESSFEVLLVDDGSDDDHILQYRKLVERFGDRVFLSRSLRVRKHEALGHHGIVESGWPKVNSLHFVIVLVSLDSANFDTTAQISPPPQPPAYWA